MARRLENSVGIAVDVDELRLGEDVKEEPDSPGMERGLKNERLSILAGQLLDEPKECRLPFGDLGLGDVAQGPVAGIMLGPPGEDPAQ